MCTTKDIGELFLGKPDEMVLAFDTIATRVLSWDPSHMGASIHTIVFTNKKAWLIIKPMKKELDIKFYHAEKLDSDLIMKSTLYRNKYAHHIRVSAEYEISNEFFELLRVGYDFAMQD